MPWLLSLVLGVVRPESRVLLWSGVTCPGPALVDKWPKLASLTREYKLLETSLEGAYHTAAGAMHGEPHRTRRAADQPRSHAHASVPSTGCRTSSAHSHDVSAEPCTMAFSKTTAWKKALCE